jgi:hypothetical protein
MNRNRPKCTKQYNIELNKQIMSARDMREFCDLAIRSAVPRNL